MGFCSIQDEGAVTSERRYRRSVMINRPVGQHVYPLTFFHLPLHWLTFLLP